MKNILSVFVLGFGNVLLDYGGPMLNGVYYFYFYIIGFIVCIYILHHTLHMTLSQISLKLLFFMDKNNFYNHIGFYQLL